MISYSSRTIHRDADHHEPPPVQHDTLDDRDQTGLTTAAHEAERTEPGSTAVTVQTPWPKRLEELARHAVTSPSRDLDRETAQSIHHHLDALAGILGHPPRVLAQAVERSHSRSVRSELVGSDVSGTKEPIQEEPVPAKLDETDRINKSEIVDQLQLLLNEVTALNGEVEKRRKESNEIRELFEERCRGLTRTVAELEDEVLELQGDLVEDSIELEGIQGTIRGLQDWIYGMREAQKMPRIAKERSRLKARRRWGGRGSSEDRVETDGEVMLDGLTAWMRGWKDVEEGFQMRSRARQTRREQRQGHLARSRKKGAD
ncbi:hypothetical protein N7532_011924 [Penicillium argentinense]|uniref:Uncharacterized protein n=1 Tax=Penicillium argentinense TaxID=1131581 RepID=A0A9W9EJA7_9EURO|nr:uncharacterized protein N7532_011924 [Penicillium argentinense]KAJ5082881.1 hypothetical protein N7532_011924 [Penicillium argentinense]